MSDNLKPHEVKHSPRAIKRPISEYKKLLRVDVDWGSTGIWAINEPGAACDAGNLRYKDFPISKDLRKRFEQWTEWYDLSKPEDADSHADWELHNLYGWSLAIDLKRELGDDYYVEYDDREIHDDMKFLTKLNWS